ncbi:MAG: amidophosphoribosyltransferase [Chthoniobacterales bacterium]|jgi:amidophosphoribosyltransferase
MLADDAHDKPRHECGVFGVFGHENAALLSYYGLFALQHRGQESAGIVTSEGPGHPFHAHRAMGLVSQVFDAAALAKLKGDRAIGHVRYSTTGSSTLANAQPLVADTVRGPLAIAHNGNLVNAAQLRAELEQAGSIFQTTADSEIILHLLARQAAAGEPLAALRALQGAFSLVLLTPEALVGVRDPHGFRPLVLGRLGSSYVLASETSALDLLGAKLEREIAPGEVVVIDANGLRSLRPFAPARPAFCIFELVYFARPDSKLGGRNVAEMRVEMGRRLAREQPVEADIVVPVPDSGNYAAQGYSEESGIPLVHAFVRNHYIGRTFLQPSQMIRDFDVRVKLNLIADAVRGKRVVVVDDSIVRGTTARARVVNLRDCGAREVHLRISCPAHRFPCHYGIDFPDPQELLANRMTTDEIVKFLGANSLAYLSLDDMIASTGWPPEAFCTACFSGDYPIPVGELSGKDIMENGRGRSGFFTTGAPGLFDNLPV